MIDIESLEYRIGQLERRYDGDNDLIPGAPDVTWADFQLLTIIKIQTKMIMDLQRQIEEMRHDPYVSGSTSKSTWRK